MRIVFFIYVLVLSCVWSQNLQAQQGLNVFDNSQSHVLGQSNLAANELTAISLNPAAMIAIDHFYTSVGVMQSYLIRGLYNGNAEVGFKLYPNHFIGIQAGYSGLSNFNELRLSTGYALRLADKTSIGLKLHGFRFAAPENSNKFAGTFSLGMRTDIIPYLSIAATAFNPIGLFKAEKNNELSHQIRVGLDYKPADYLSLYLAGNLDNDFPLAISGGVLYSIRNKLFMYLGAATEPAYIGVGLGYQFSSKSRIDLSAIRHLELGLSPAMSLIYGK